MIAEPGASGWSSWKECYWMHRSIDTRDELDGVSAEKKTHAIKIDIQQLYYRKREERRTSESEEANFDDSRHRHTHFYQYIYTSAIVAM